MATKLTQALVERAKQEHEVGTQIYDAEVSGLRVVVGRRSSSYKLVGRINDGTDRYFSIVIGRTDEVSLRKARERATELRLALRRGEDPRRPRSSVPTLGEAFERYLEARRDEITQGTIRQYECKFDGALKPLHRIPVDKIDRAMVRSLHEELTRKRGPYSANHSLRLLRLLINDVGRTHDLPPNPVTRGVRMNRETARDWALGPKEMPVLWSKLDAMEDRVRRGCWLTMLLTGLRSADAICIRWDEIDEDNVLTRPCPKGGESKAFRVPLPRALVQELGEVRELTRPLESPYAFASLDNGTGHIKPLRRSRTFDHSPHAMRHTYRTHALEAGIDFQTVTLLLNHANPHVSFNYVTRAHLVGHMREAQEAVCKRLVAYRRP